MPTHPSPRIARFETLREVLVAATADRDQRREFINGELGWITHERAVMLNAVNTIRDRDGLDPITEDQIRTAEGLACGHIDYVKKFALYAADLTFDQEPSTR